MTKKELWMFKLFDITFLLGYLFRLLVFGWGMYILGIPEYILRSTYYLLGTYILVKNMSKKSYWQIYTLQFFYLLTSFFSVDAGDISAYTFANLWQNPPSYIGVLWACFAGITLALLIIFFVLNVKIKRSDGEVHVNWFFKVLMGCLSLPSLSLVAFIMLAKFFNL
ncbi:hypothetical protein [Legionella sp. W05-934-2]|uniref:hypothetical protein n=1 Tax=Legionella sp. W05-934-2 TaxID=1198649 RepID=UPI00346255F0